MLKNEHEHGGKVLVVGCHVGLSQRGLWRLRKGKGIHLSMFLFSKK